MPYIDGERKLRNLRIPEIKLDVHRLAFRKWIVSEKPTANTIVVETIPSRFSRVKGREVVMASLIAALTAISVYNFKPIYNTEDAIATKINRLTVIPILKTANIETQNTLKILQNGEESGGLYAVLPAEKHLYRWFVDDSSILSVEILEESFITRVSPKSPGETFLRVKDIYGGEGVIHLRVE